MSQHYGDFPTSHAALCMVFDSFAAATGASSAASSFAAGDVLIYKDGGTTQRSSSSGIVASTSFDSQTGLQMVTIDLSDNTDAGFYAAGHEYQVAVADISIDGQTVRFWLGTFSIERAGGVLALLKGANGVAAIKTDTAAIKTKTDFLPSATAGAAGGLFIAGTNAATVITTSLTTHLIGTVDTVTTLTDVNAAADALLDRANAIETGITPRKALRLSVAADSGKVSGMATSTVTIRDAADSKDRIIATVDASGNRLSVTRDLS